MLIELGAVMQFSNVNESDCVRYKMVALPTPSVIIETRGGPNFDCAPENRVVVRFGLRIEPPTLEIVGDTIKPYKKPSINYH